MENITVWQLKIFGSTITTAHLKDALAVIESEAEQLESEEPFKVTLDKVLMTQEEYEALPEFDGY